jgi:hypothetical protein
MGRALICQDSITKGAALLRQPLKFGNKISLEVDLRRNPARAGTGSPTNLKMGTNGKQGQQRRQKGQGFFAPFALK